MLFKKYIAILEGILFFDEWRKSDLILDKNFFTKTIQIILLQNSYF